MRLQEWYKCKHCPEFHPIGLDSFVKGYVAFCAEKHAQAEANDKRPKEYFRHIILLRILKTSAPDKICQYFERLDQNIANVKAWTDNNNSIIYDRGCNQKVVKQS